MTDYDKLEYQFYKKVSDLFCSGEFDELDGNRIIAVFGRLSGQLCSASIASHPGMISDDEVFAKKASVGLCFFEAFEIGIKSNDAELAKHDPLATIQGSA